jgi:hypothetical protein
MSYFDDASLVMIPSGYKDQKVYSVKPIDGSGDLTFTRSNDTATRVGPDGLIQKVRTNLALQSQTFDNASWTKYQSSVTANSTTAPDGTLTADTLADTAVNDTHQIEQNIVFPSSEVTISIFAKANTLSHIKITAYDGAGFRDSGIFNLSNGTVSGAGSIISAGNGWYRCSHTFSSTGGAGVSYVFTSNGLSTIYAGSGQSIFIWGYQLETGVATDYIATTSAAVSVGPVANLPRLDYSGGATCPKLLLEPQRTNVITNNNDFATGAANVTVLSNNATSPEGYQNADLITGDAGTLTKVTNFNGASAGAYTLSVFAKYNTQQWIQLGAGGIASFANFDIQNGVVGTTNATSSIEDYGNGWYRCSLNMVSGTPLSHYVGIITNGTSARLATTASTGSFWAYGIQSEIGAYPTSVIPTLGAAVTRGAESSSSASIPSLFGGTEGSFFIEMTFDGKNPNGSIPLFLRSSINSSFNQATYLQFGASNINYNVYSGGISQFALSGGSFTNGQNIKVAFAYKANDFALYVNGVQLGTFNSGAISTSLSFIDLGSYLDLQSTFQYDGKISQAILFPTRLSNADLATLTA